MLRAVATAFPGFNPAEILEMDLDDLAWWHNQAEQLAEEMNNG